MNYTSFIRDLANLRENLYVSEAEIFINKYKELLPELPAEGKEEPLTKWILALQYAAEYKFNPQKFSEKFKKNYQAAINFRDSEYYHEASIKLFSSLHLTQAAGIKIKIIGGDVMVTKNETREEKPEKKKRGRPKKTKKILHRPA
jgi:hypothetical protein